MWKQVKEVEYLFDAPSKVNEAVLPTIADIIKYSFYTQKLLKHNRNGIHSTISEVNQIPREKLEEMWKKKSIIIVSQRCINQMIYDIFF